MMKIKNFSQYVNENMENSMPGYPDIVVYDKRHAQELKRAMLMAQNTSTVDIQQAGYILTNYDETNNTIEFKGIGTVPYSEVMSFIETKL